MYGRPVLKGTAEDRIERFREDYPAFPKGIHFTIEELRSYLATWEAILEIQPPPPSADYTYAVGHHFAYDANNKATFIVAPVLVHSTDASLTRDALSSPGDFTIQDTDPYFFYNEGQKWP